MIAPVQARPFGTTNPPTIPRLSGFPDPLDCDERAKNRHTQRSPLTCGVGLTPEAQAATPSLSRVVRGSVLEAYYSVSLRTFLTLDDIELNVIALFQGFVSVQLNRRIVNEYIWPVIASDETVALGVVEPLDLPFVLSHWLLPSLHRAACIWEIPPGSCLGKRPSVMNMTIILKERLDFICSKQLTL
jgi:hypothetical protein